MPRKIFAILILLALCAPFRGAAQNYTVSPTWALGALSEERLLQQVEYLADSVCAGRRTGTPGSARTKTWLINRFKDCGLVPCGGGYTRGFQLPDGTVGHNIIGAVPGRSAGRYIIVAAHFDGLGILDGKMYRGADSNASGVVAMLSLAEMLREMNAVDVTYDSTVLFVGLDGKLLNMSGAESLWANLTDGDLRDPVTGTVIRPEDVSLFVNLDQLGCSLAPLRSGNPAYLILLSEDGTVYRSALASCNFRYDGGLELAFDYYGSADFTRLFFRRICDQKVFLDHGCHAVMFTSGITMNNNKPSDDASTLDIPVFAKRIALIFYWLTKVM